jgi:hypothetical protein
MTIQVSGRALSVVAVAMAVFAAREAHATTPISLSTMNTTLLPDDCDIIDVTITPHGAIPNTRGIDLQSSPEVDAWKAIDVPQLAGQSTQPYTENQHRFSSGSLPAQLSTLTFEKAKFAGVHTAVYTLDVSTVPLGSLITFTWQQDSCPGFNGVLDGALTHVPPAVATNQPFTAVVSFFNVTGGAWLQSQRIRMVDPQGIWSVPPIDIPSTTTLWQDATFTFSAIAPGTPGVKKFTFVLEQEGGKPIAKVDRQIAVGLPPTQPPPPTPMTSMPNIVGMTLPNGVTALQTAQLQEGFAYDFDPNFFGTKTVISQSVVPGTRIPVGTSIDISISDANAPGGDGWSSIIAFNCRPLAVEVWKADRDTFRRVATVPPNTADNGTCDQNISGVTVPLTAKTWNWFVIVDPNQPACTVPRDPTNPDCIPYEWIGFGDSHGQTFPFTVPPP